MAESVNRTLAVFDIDGVLVRGESQKQFASFLRKKGKIGGLLFLRIACWFVAYRLGFIKDTLPMRNAAYRAFQGWSEETMSAEVEDFFNSAVKGRMVPAAVELLRNHQQAGDSVLLLSASLEPVVKRIARSLGVRDFIATRLEMKDGRYSGRIEGSVPHGTAKREALERYLKAHQKHERIRIYADHRSDECVLSAATEAVAVNPDPELKAIARRKEWEILELS